MDQLTQKHTLRHPSENESCICGTNKFSSVSHQTYLEENITPHTQKHWRKLNLEIGPNLVIAKILVDLIGSVQD